MPAELLQALVTGVVTAVGTILVVGTWLWKLSKSLDRIPEIEKLISQAAGEAQEALRHARAAHRRLDDQSDKLQAVKSRVEILDERSQNQSKQVEAIASQIMAQLDRLNEKLDEAIRDGIVSGKR